MSYKLSEAQISGVVDNGSKYFYSYCREYNIHYAVFGLSGGLDSAITAGFATRARNLARRDDFSLTPVALIMPCQSSNQSGVLAQKVIQIFELEHLYINLDYLEDFLHRDTIRNSGLHNRIRDILEGTSREKDLPDWAWSQKTAFGNIKARLRMIVAYHVARMMDGIVLSTDNLSEYWMGFWTLHGDVGDFGIIQKVLKGLELYDIARYLSIPQEILDARPDDGLGVTDGGDEAQLGAPYPVVDRVMVTLIQNGFDVDGSLSQLGSLPEVSGVGFRVVYKLADRCLRNAFKRKVGGCISLSREQLRLPAIKDIKL